MSIKKLLRNRLRIWNTLRLPEAGKVEEKQRRWWSGLAMRNDLLWLWYVVLWEGETSVEEEWKWRWERSNWWNWTGTRCLDISHFYFLLSCSSSSSVFLVHVWSSDLIWFVWSHVDWAIFCHFHFSALIKESWTIYMYIVQPSLYIYIYRYIYIDVDAASKWYWAKTINSAFHF